MAIQSCLARLAQARRAVRRRFKKNFISHLSHVKKIIAIADAARSGALLEFLIGSFSGLI